ncbi:GNAT family N-acetyltransferase [Erysipelothrix anatis]|uniref:GNAT family N-acetyltransferase n=1 Tax=Erysipelothrix anatis TaxID=2683713 RepID=UPI0014088903
MINLRKYERNMLESMIRVFFDAVHESTGKDYNKAQQDAWTGSMDTIDRDTWHHRFATSHTIVAFDHNRLVGFANLVDNYIDMLYVDPKYHRQGIAQTLLTKLEGVSQSETYFEVDASMSARLFFEQQGYEIYAKQEHIRGKVTLINYKMRKTHVVEGVNMSLLTKQAEALLEGETDLIANLANISALINMNMDRINWVGFYLFKEDHLILGPFQGKPACVHLYPGKGVCAAALEANETMNVADVHAFPGHVACDAASRSELVIPIYLDGKPFGVLDIDSPELNRFTKTDEVEMEAIVSVLLDHLAQIKAIG